jgi:hypothetical protein
VAKTTIWTLILTLALTSAAFAATGEEKCQKKKLLALGKRDLCLQKERGKEVLGKTPDVANCAEKFDKMIASAEKVVACRWLDNGDGTATDLDSGLQWELKTDDLSIHDNDVYAWSDTSPFEDPDGGAFVEFLGTLNGGTSAGGVTTKYCFADKCDWRLPTIEELADIVDLTAPGCGGGSPCTTIPGEILPVFYFSSSSGAAAPVAPPSAAWGVHFVNGSAGPNGKNYPLLVLAVRGGS